MSRAKWKGPFIRKSKQNIISRASEILPNFVGLTFSIHNGQIFKDHTVTKDMIGHKFGEFFNTRAKYVFKKKKQKKKNKLSKWGKK